MSDGLSVEWRLVRNGNKLKGTEIEDVEMPKLGTNAEEISIWVSRKGIWPVLVISRWERNGIKWPGIITRGEIKGMRRCFKIKKVETVTVS